MITATAFISGVLLGMFITFWRIRLPQRNQNKELEENIKVLDNMYQCKGLNKND